MHFTNAVNTPIKNIETWVGEKNMFIYKTPEEKGIKSQNIKKYIEILEKAGLSTHNLIIARGNDIVYENYWAPFHKDFLHRQYSVSKSFVAIAVGFAIQDGKMKLDDKLVDFFDDEYIKNCGEVQRTQTIRNMLMMSTGHGEGSGWFGDQPEDRVRHYFDTSSNGFCKIPGGLFKYDSEGSFVLGAIVEKVTGMPLMEYLRKKLFDKIGVSKEATCLKCPGGASWGDSAVLCTATDLLKVARFTMNYGKWNGEQILNEKFLRDATSDLLPTANTCEHPSTYGYGYLIWKTQQNGFFFNGMGCQFAICVPHKDIIMIYNGDNQGISSAKTIIIDNFFNLIVNEADESSAVNEKAYSELCEYSKKLELIHEVGGRTCEKAYEIAGKTFVLEENPMGIKNIKFTFQGDEGKFEYENAQGEKTLKFGFNKNIFGLFPQTGYSKEVGSVYETGHCYKGAYSGKWLSNNTLYLNVQIIDDYFGRLHMYFQFGDENTVTVQMKKVAEDFLKEYSGMAQGEAQ